MTVAEEEVPGVTAQQQLVSPPDTSKAVESQQDTSQTLILHRLRWARVWAPVWGFLDEMCLCTYVGKAHTIIELHGGELGGAPWGLRI